MNHDSSLDDNQGGVPQINEKPMDNQFSSSMDYPQDNYYNQDNNISQQYPVGIKSGQNSDDDQAIQATIRNGFIAKVFGIVAIQLTFTFTFILLCHTKIIKDFIAHNEGFCTLLVVTSIIGFIVSACLISCSRSMARKVPTNYILLFLVTLSESILSTSASIYYPIEIVVAAIVLTIAASLGIIIYALKTKRDMTSFGMALFVLASQLFFFGLLSLFIRSQFLHLLYTSLCTLMIGMYLVYDVQLISGKFGIQYSVEDYIFAAMELYIDIIRLFLEILRILSKFQKNNN